MGVQDSALAFANPLWKRVFPDLIPQEEIDVSSVKASQGRAARLRVVPLDTGEDTTQARRATSQLRATILSFQNMHQHGELFVNMLRMRHSIFIDSKGWALPEVDGMEFDQYDIPRARWIVLHEYGEILGGVRLLPTTSQCGQYSYMIRDAQNGLLENIPRDLLFFRAPVRDDIWEATRLFVSPKLSAERRIELQKRLLAEMAIAARELGATHVIGIVPAVFSRWMTRLGLMSALPVGRILEIDGERTQAALMYVGD